ncbi:hypothetical protein HOE04_02570 [archaeon]|nr:hypothetical protein [archaeon]
MKNMYSRSNTLQGHFELKNPLKDNSRKSNVSRQNQNRLSTLKGPFFSFEIRKISTLYRPENSYIENFQRKHKIKTFEDAYKLCMLECRIKAQETMYYRGMEELKKSLEQELDEVQGECIDLMVRIQKNG